MKLFLDIDGTIANTYDVSGWLDALEYLYFEQFGL